MTYKTDFAMVYDAFGYSPGGLTSPNDCCFGLPPVKDRRTWVSQRTIVSQAWAQHNPRWRDIVDDLNQRGLPSKLPLVVAVVGCDGSSCFTPAEWAAILSLDKASMARNLRSAEASARGFTP